jgi:hypothetical protein
MPSAGAEPAAPAAAAKPTLKLGVSPEGAPKTVRLKPAGSLAPKPLAAAPTMSGQASKKETSKIPLEAAKPAMGARAPTLATVKKETSPLEGASQEVLDAKRKTSRISLESVLAADDAGKAESAPGAPKTIKLKRPSEAVTVKAIRKGPSAPVASEAMSKTAPLEEAAAPAEGEAQAGRKTVKVKKPTMKIRKPEDGVPAAAAAGAVGAAPATAAYVDSAHWTFITFGILTFLVITVSIWMFTSQVIGPNYCLTQASYSPQNKELTMAGNPDLYRAGSTDLPWPGKLRKGPAR